MLTIKHVEPGGHESIQEARSVSVISIGTPEGQEYELTAFGCVPNGGAVDIHGVCRYGDGVVYVMNDHGSTVGHYRLG